MQLPRLSRLDGVCGSSSGWWAVRDLPGVVLMRHSGKWSFYHYPPALQVPPPGRDQDLDEAARLLRTSNLERQQFTTRREALQALGAALALAG